MARRDTKGCSHDCAETVAAPRRGNFSVESALCDRVPQRKVGSIHVGMRARGDATAANLIKS